MSWQILRQREGGVRRFCDMPSGRSLDRGTLVLELDLAALPQSKVPVVRVAPHREPGRIFAVEAMSDGRMHLLRRHGAEVNHLSVGLGREPTSGRLRLSYHWDRPRNLSLLTSENLTRGTIRQQEAPSALPILPEEISALFGAEAKSIRHPALDWVSLADHWQTVGPMPGFAPDTLIDTVNGPHPIAALRPGDRVLTADSGDQPVLWQGRVGAPAVGSLRTVRLIAPCFGLPNDVILRSGQRVALSGADVEYLFGDDMVLVEARHLVDGRTALWDEDVRIVVSHGLLLDRHALIRAGGVWTESLYLGRIGRNVELARSTVPGALAERGQMPLHHGPVRRELLEFEVHALRLARRNGRPPLAA
ncbi:Hint domain-containing protein [Defluviimonas sp. SAOS-178_SWC]|uniref:Hint domain-containing protein n=1 Tax=Defluviimonas sp. SAOS-178_SWC TaxID=3121287 RepID=UPI0032217AE8